MIIGFFTDWYLPQLNGVATSTEAWARELEKLGHKVYIIAPNYPGYKDGENVIRLTSFKFIKQPEIRLATYLPVKSMLEISRIKFDVIHGFCGGAISTLGLIAARLKKIPYIFTYYTRLNHYTHYVFKGKILSPKMMERASRIFCNRCDYLIVPAQKIKDELVSFGVKKPIAVIPGGVDIDKFSEHKKGFLREKTGIKTGKILLYVGRLGKEKSVDFLLKTFKIMYDKDRLINLVLVGNGAMEKNLKQLAEDLGINKNVYFAGLIDSKEMNKVYADADIFVFASQTETQGMVILEALASGLPVVAVKDAVYDGIMQNKINGILVDNDTRKFAAECLGILNNESYRKKLSENAINGMRNFSLPTTAKSLEKLYEKLVAQKK